LYIQRIQLAAKLNQIPKLLPEGWVASARWLGEHGYSRSQLAQYKEQGHWLESPVRGAYVRPGVKMRWQHVVVSLQRLEQLPLHVGGRTALVHRGLAHYLRFGDPETIHLYGPVGLPAWARKLQLPERLKTHSDAMFGSLRRVWRDEAGQILGDHNTSPRSGVLEQSCLTDFTWEHWDWRITYSTEERAIFEVLQDVPKHESIYEADVLMAGLVNLRPTRIQKLLSRCASIKVKRLFLALAERHRHVWFKELDLQDVDLGAGKRMLIPGGKLHPKYQITLPADLDDQAR
jgi:hypothetical protein